MTPKEKAKELIFKFYDIEKNDGYFDYPLFIFSQKCALIAVDEIIKEVPTEILDTYKGETQFIINDNYKYWLKVKEEINKL
jgi:hypothetical protein